MHFAIPRSPSMNLANACLLSAPKKRLRLTGHMHALRHSQTLLGRWKTFSHCVPIGTRVHNTLWSNRLVLGARVWNVQLTVVT